MFPRTLFKDNIREYRLFYVSKDPIYGYYRRIHIILCLCYIVMFPETLSKDIIGEYRLFYDDN